MKRPLWIVSLVLALLLATVPAMAMEVVSDRPIPGASGTRLCVVKLDPSTLVLIVYVDQDRSATFTQGVDRVLSIKSYTLSRSIAKQDGPDLQKKKRL